MPHIAQERYSSLVDEKLRATLVTKDNLIFNPRYEGNPKAGKVKVPVRDTEVEVKKYDKQKGAAISAGWTVLVTLWGCPWIRNASVLWRKPQASPLQPQRPPARTALHTSRYWQQSERSPVWACRTMGSGG